MDLEVERRCMNKSARNSSYWLHLVARSHSDLSLQASAPSRPAPTISPLNSDSWSRVESIDSIDDADIAQEIVYEHQRYQLVLGWGSKGCLLPLDPKKYTNAQYTEQFPVFPTLALPPDEPNRGAWEWITPWQIYVNADADVEGWKYSTSFSHLKIESAACFNCHRSTTFCRRRKWIRKRLFVSIDAPNSEIHTGLDDAHLDSKSGWLNKLGHRRKNWKRRYFVLDGSVLQYYTDDVSKAKNPKLKGEVLLFHKETTVHYTDNSRDFTFSIDAGTYSLLLQAASEVEREAWVYAIEDAILCRDSYSLDDEAANNRRKDVVRRRSLSTSIPNGSLQDVCLICEAIVNMENEVIRQFVKKYQYHFEITSQLEAIESKVVRALKSYRTFIERTLVHVLEQFCLHMKRQGHSQDKIEGIYFTARETSLLHIEQSAFVPIQNTIHGLLLQSIADFDHYNTQRAQLVLEPQAFFDIRPGHISPSNWQSCVEQLNKLDEFPLPSRKGIALVQTAKSIYTLFQEEHGSNDYLAADDFLPIFIYVLCHSQLHQVPLTRRIMSETTISSIMIGEIGYYTTMLEAAVEFIMSYNPRSI
ncbi:hypothetical protein THRCLA_00874 [Thraustotheca clavata]|uniref:VPS9 domain-containing protein n=1 Tax=Thraustotheca clavata TaxID=74557 RepID=A0A1W0AA98_9STRA|nr:hypothetical protein THRCLA_00874 [Thraustotheca clavata]